MGSLPRPVDPNGKSRFVAIARLEFSTRTVTRNSSGETFISDVFRKYSIKRNLDIFVHQMYIKYFCSFVAFCEWNAALSSRINPIAGFDHSSSFRARSRFNKKSEGLSSGGARNLMNPRLSKETNRSPGAYIGGDPLTIASPIIKPAITD